jgi:four helix bundle protein
MINFVVRIVHLCDALPRRASTRHIADQLLRSGTSPAANYAEARRAEGTRDFIHKLKICQKELNEARV